MISIVIPTISGREDHLARCVDAYVTTLGIGYAYELLIIKDQPTCGAAWNMGAMQASGQFLHFSADDLEPLDGWWRPAIEVALAGNLPAPRILGPDARLESCGEWGIDMAEGWEAQMSRIPFMTIAQWEKIGPSLNIHYYTDDWLSLKGRLYGMKTVVARGYLFKHHWAMVGRGAGMNPDDRMTRDQQVFENAVKRLA